jgi:hypothetical protein
MTWRVILLSLAWFIIVFALTAAIILYNRQPNTPILVEATPATSIVCNPALPSRVIGERRDIGRMT